MQCDTFCAHILLLVKLFTVPYNPRPPRNLGLVISRRLHQSTWMASHWDPPCLMKSLLTPLPPCMTAQVKAIAKRLPLPLPLSLTLPSSRVLWLGSFARVKPLSISLSPLPIASMMLASPCHHETHVLTAFCLLGCPRPPPPTHSPFSATSLHWTPISKTSFFSGVLGMPRVLGRCRWPTCPSLSLAAISPHGWSYMGSTWFHGMSGKHCSRLTS